MEKKAAEIVAAVQVDETVDKEDYIETPKIADDSEIIGLEKLEARLNQLDSFLVKQVEQTDEQTYTQHADYIESELQEIKEKLERLS